MVKDFESEWAILRIKKSHDILLHFQNLSAVQKVDYLEEPLTLFDSHLQGHVHNQCKLLFKMLNLMSLHSA